MGGFTFRNPEDVFREFFGGTDPFADFFGMCHFIFDVLKRNMYMEQKEDIEKLHQNNGTFNVFNV